MGALEISLVALLLVLCVWTSATDVKSSVIGNRQLLIAAGVGLVLNLMYYLGPAQEYAVNYLMNFAILTVISLLFYAFHFWAAGDSKLLILISFLLPSRLFGKEGGNAFPAVIILILSFSIAFLYIVIDSVCEGIKRKDLFSANTVGAGFKRFLKSYVLCGTYLTLLNQAAVILFSDAYLRYNELFVLGSFFAAVVVSERPLPKKKAVFIPCLIMALSLTGYMMSRGQLITDPMVFSALLVLVLLRLLVEKYSYEEIATEQVKKGMVLSFATTAALNMAGLFKPARAATEDVRSRLSEEEAERIRQWSGSRTGEKSVVIVKKVPFAIFISIGTVLFMIVRLCPR